MAAIDPHRCQAKVVPGQNIVVLALGGMKNFALADAAPRSFADGSIEVRLIRLVGANILRRYREQEGHGQYLERAGQRPVVNVRKDRKRKVAPPIAEPFGGVREWTPMRHGSRKFFRAAGIFIPSELVLDIAP